MSVPMKSKSPGLNSSQIEKLQMEAGLIFPDAYRRFLANGNVVEPELNVVNAQGMIGSVTLFLGLSNNKLEDLLTNLRLYADRIPRGFIPIALAGGGNLFCMDHLNSSVYLWDHEMESLSDRQADFDNMHFVARSFSEFIDKINPLDESSVKLNTSDVMSVKKNPDFEQKFKKYLK